MQALQLGDLKRIARVYQPNCVTVCLPTHININDQQEDILRLKTLTDEVERQLNDMQVGEREIRKLTGKLHEIIADKDFWQSRGHGLAIFLNLDGIESYRVPFNLEELVVVSDRFCIKPVLPLFHESMKLFALIISQHQVRLFEKTEFTFEEIGIDLPQRLEETLNLQCVDGGPQSHFAKPGGKGKATSVFHGHGGKKDTHKDELKLFFRAIDEQLQKFLQDERAPLVLGGVDYLLPLYREVSHYGHIASPELVGNWDYASNSELHQQLEPLVAPVFAEHRKQAFEKYFDLKNSGRATDDLATAVPAAFQGRVEVLFVDIDQHIWGRCAEEGQCLEVHGARQVSDQDLLDTVAAETLLHGGKVYAVKEADMPSHSKLAAVMRF